jgi:F0F1-type ATP synthase alpha subunit
MELLRGLAMAYIGMRELGKSLVMMDKGHKEMIKRQKEEQKRFLSLRGKNFRVQKGRKVLRTYKILDVRRGKYFSGKILFRERVFSKTSIKEHTRVRYQSLDVLENKLGRKVI